MKKVLYKIFKIFFIIILIYLLLLLFVYMLYSLYGSKNQAKSEYFNKIKKHNKEINLNEVFNDFEWDKAYILKDNEMTVEEIQEEIGINCDLSVIDTSWSDTNRINTIVFIRNDECVYEFYYDEKYLKFDNKGDFVDYDNSKYKLKKGLMKLHLYFEDIN